MLRPPPPGRVNFSLPIPKRIRWNIVATPVNDTALQDGPLNAWESQAIQNYVHAYITAHNITNLVTFDEEGVSGHPNHLPGIWA